MLVRSDRGRALHQPSVTATADVGHPEGLSTQEATRGERGGHALQYKHKRQRVQRLPRCAAGCGTRSGVVAAAPRLHLFGACPSQRQF